VTNGDSEIEAWAYRGDGADNWDERDRKVIAPNTTETLNVDHNAQLYVKLDAKTKAGEQSTINIKLEW
jgi:hypothetical protein